LPTMLNALPIKIVELISTLQIAPIALHLQPVDTAHMLEQDVAFKNLSQVVVVSYLEANGTLVLLEPLQLDLQQVLQLFHPLAQ